MQPWLNQESNQQTVNIKSKEVYLSQQTQTPITEVVRTEKVNWQYIQRGVRQQTIQQYPAQRIGIEQPSEKAVHYRAEHRHRTQRSTPSIREPRGRERAVWQSITQRSAVPPRAAVQEAKKAAVQQATRTQRTAQVAQRTAKEAAKASGRALRAILAAARSLYAALAAGGMVTLSILVLICLFGVLAASPFGIVYVSEDEKADLTLPSAIATLNAEFSERVEQCKEDYTGQYDRVQVDASAIPNWTDILAVYAVKTSMDKEDPVEVATMDQKKLVLLRKICEEMTPLSATLRSEGEKTVLVIQLQPKTYRKMADEYHFDQEQRKMLEELIDSGLLDLFLEANEPTEEDGPIQPGSGGYAWPLPGYTRISSPFAYRNCPYHGRELHGGIDLPAPRGTSILAAKAGVVAKSTYNASYGNYVVLRHPDGTQTLYAHMSARTVTAGQTVHQGMVIGKVGSTGNSTGNHLHFETWTSSSSGSRVNPMQYF